MITPRRSLAPFVLGGVALQFALWASADLVGMILTFHSRAGFPIAAPAVLLALPMTFLLPLPAGVLVDRGSRRSALVWAGPAGAVALGSLGVAALTDTITPAHLTLAVGVTTLAGVTAALALEAYLPAVAERRRFVPVNAVFHVIAAAGTVAAPALAFGPAGGSAPVLMAVPAVAFLLVAALFGRLAAEEEPAPARAGLWRETTAGLRFTLDHPVLWPIVRYLAVLAMLQPLLWEAADRVEGMPGSWQPAVRVAAPLAGALAAVLLHRRVGTLRLAWAAVLVTQPFALLLAFPSGPAGYVLGQALPWAGTATAAVALLSHRQAITPPRLLGRSGGVLLTFTALGALASALAESLAWAVASLSGGVRFWLAAPAVAGVMAAALPLLRAGRLEAAHEAEQRFLARLDAADRTRNRPGSGGAG